MKTGFAIKRRCAWEALVIVLLVFVVWRVGMSHLKEWGGPAGSLTNDLFIPAIMMNAGHGFRNVDASHIPALRAFLDFQEQRLDTAALPENMNLIPLHPYQEFHRYLLYSTALVWRIFGVSWDAMKILNVAYLIFACVAIYAICRLAMNSVFAFSSALLFATSPPVYLTLPVLRDFAKAPFILVVALLLGLFITKRLTQRRLFLASLLLGITLGVGMGIRRDMLVFLPISVLFVFVARLALPGYGTTVRIWSAALLLAAFFISALPIHRALAREGYLAAHDTIMGFSSYSDHELGVLQPASYEKHYLLNDMYSTIRAHYAAGLGVTFPAEIYQARGNEFAYDFEMKSAYVNKIAATFPADILARAYAAVLRISTGIIDGTSGFEKYGLWFVVAGLLLIASRSPFQAWLVLAMLCFFCGYTSIQFAFRHAFHTSFVPFFFAGFVIHHIGLRALRKIRPELLASGGEEQPFGGKAGLMPLLRAFTWALITLLLFILPLQAARAWQSHYVRALRVKYSDAAVTSVPHRVTRWEERTLIAPTVPVRSIGFERQGLLEDFESGMLVATFANVDLPLDLHAVYEWEGGISNFGGPLSAEIHRTSTSEDLRFYFPIHEKVTYDADWSRFVGISMSDETAERFTGFHAGVNLRDFGLLLNMTIPETPDNFLSYQCLSIPWHGSSWTPFAVTTFDPAMRAHEIDMLQQVGNYEQAAELAALSVDQRPGSIVFALRLAAALWEMGREQESFEVLIALIEEFPHIAAVYERLDVFLQERGGPSARAAGWELISERVSLPESAASYLLRARQAIATPSDY